MKQFLSILIWFLSLKLTCFAQVDYRDEELKSNIQYFRNALVSFGMDTIITFRNSEGKIITKKIYLTVGTGVIFYINYKDYYVPCVVTAKHVLKDSLSGWMPRSLRLRFAQHDTLPVDSYFGDTYKLFGDKNLPVWLEHPDSTVDLAAFLLDLTKENTKNLKGVIPYNLIPDDYEYFEGKEIFVLGYPGAVGVDLLNRSVLRKGIISWVPPNIQKSGSKILIDCNIFPGNSGGPVFSTSKNVGTILTDTVFLKPKFYGIVSQRRFSYNLIESKGKVVKDATGNAITSIESIGIGVIITAKKVRELLNYLQRDFAKWIDEEELKEKKRSN